MDKKTFMIRVAIWTAVVVAVILTIVYFVAPNIEGSVGENIGKYVIMWVGLTAICEALMYTVGQVIYDFWVRPKVEKKKEEKEK